MTASGTGLVTELALGELTDNIRRLVAAASSASVGGGTSGVCSRDSGADEVSVLEHRMRFASGSLSSSESRACFLQSRGDSTDVGEVGLLSCLDLFNRQMSPELYPA